MNLVGLDKLVCLTVAVSQSPENVMVLSNVLTDLTDRSELADCGKLSMNLVGLDKLVCLTDTVSQSLENVMVLSNVSDGRSDGKCNDQCAQMMN